MEENNKEMLMRVLYDLESALKLKKDSDGNRIYTDEYIEDILKKLEGAYDTKKIKLIKKRSHV